MRAAIRSDVDPQEFCELLLTDVQAAKDQIVDVVALGELGRLVLSQNLLAGDKFYGTELLTLANSLDTDGKLSRQILRVLIQHHIVENNLDKASELLDEHPKIDHEVFGYLRGEMSNPFTGGESSDHHKWLASFNQVFERYNVAPIGLREDDRLLPFDRLKVSPSRREISAGPLVSVVLTVFKPDEMRLRTSVNSILDQTWHSLELIVVNDCSGPEYDDIFGRLEQLDDRLTVIHATENRGTYAARNIGYAASSGLYITGQDDDDWSHPERIERQVNFMESNPEAVGCRISAVRCDEFLGRVRVGSSPLGQNASSLFIRRVGYEQAGGFLEARKAADTEYHFRIEAVTGRQVKTLKEPLSIIRILEGSLSRGDYAPGWVHSSRRSFRSSYVHWHNNRCPQELFVSRHTSPAVKIPRRFEIDNHTESLPKFDVVFAGDWEQYGDLQKDMLEEIYALSRAGFRLAIINFQSDWETHRVGLTPLNDDIQKMINEGLVDEIYYDESIDINLLILRDPSILQFFTYEVSNLSIDSMFVVANEAPANLDGTDIKYLVEDCIENSKRAFGIEPTWVPAGPRIRKTLEHYMGGEWLSSFDLPGIINLDNWRHNRLGHRSTFPVVGRHSRDESMDWPSEGSLIEEGYPSDGRFDVRIRGSATTPLRILGADHYPNGWTVYEHDEISVGSFLYSLDYFVLYQHAHVGEFPGRQILEAMASGAVAVLPRELQAVFGEAALYSEQGELRDTITHLHSDFSISEHHRKRVESVLDRRFSYDWYVNCMTSLLAEK
ncbi:hypothetical protein GCM10009720_20920 [Yaniella flava]|uniref:Glycosyltransferase 2-like domain-containing protein n=2 Tax=Yaniella flava TaxID=287930 RepID=A0ABN2UN81_9MICC